MVTDRENRIVGFANSGLERDLDTLYTTELYAL